MAIVSNGLIQVRVRGIDQAIRQVARVNEAEKRAAKLGILAAAQYLMSKIQSKFGVYQPTGGTGGGAWEKLKYETNAKKLRKYGFMHKPLIASGDMKNSFFVKESPDKALAAHVASDDPKLIHHIYGAPRANVPRRDPMLITAVEEADNCHRIIVDHVYRAYDQEG